MRDDQASRTAAWVAAARGLGPFLPPAARLVDDPWSARLAGASIERLRALGELAPSLAGRIGPTVARPLLRLALWVQLRTRAIDEALAAFLDAGGRQLLLLDAGYDCRAWRLADRLASSTVFEVDHPATQAVKRRLLDEPHAPLELLAWDFEREPLARLPDALAARGHRREQPTFTVWEGVTPYLTPPAIDATLGAVAALSAPGSRLAFTFLHARALARPRAAFRLGQRLLRRIGEPMRFGLDPATLDGWLAARGFALVEQRSERALAEAWLPPALAQVCSEDRTVAVAAR